MLGISYGELFLILGATAALIGPKDLPVIARTAGRLAGRAIGYVQLARGQFDSVMQQTQARQVHKELQDTISQLEAIRHEIRSISLLNPGHLTQRLVDNPDLRPENGDGVPEKLDGEIRSTSTLFKAATSESSDLRSQATVFSRLAESPTVKTGSLESDAEKLDDHGHLTVLPVSAESTGMLPKGQDDVQGSDLILEAILEAEVAHNAKEFFSLPQNQIPPAPKSNTTKE